MLGLARDSLTAAFLGVSVASNAFVFAFVIPNLFRRLFGEGALTSAFIPVLSDRAQEGKGDTAAFRFVNQILLRLVVVTVVLASALGMVFFLVGGWMAHTWGQDGAWPDAMTEQWSLGALLTAVMMPYMPLICVTAILGAVLNTRQRFAVPALSNALLNVGMIGALGLGGFGLGLGAEGLVWWLAGGVLVGGVLQLLTACGALWREGWRPRLERGPVEGMDTLMRLFIPGLWGAAILQVNILVSRVLAFGLNETATTTLNYANRLVELPLGMFAVAIATVVFPQMSLCISGNDRVGFIDAYGHGLRLVLALTMPAAAGLAVLHEPVIRLLFQWGRFTENDAALTGPLLVILALAVPFYALITLMTRVFHACKDTKTPVLYAGVTFAVNLGLSLALMGPLQAKGLALANLVSAATQTALLARGITRRWPELAALRLRHATGAIVQATLALALVAWALATAAQVSIADAKMAALVACLSAIPVAALVYFAALYALKFEDRDEVLSLVRRLAGRG